jgi:hypothetical protein
MRSHVPSRPLPRPSDAQPAPDPIGTGRHGRQAVEHRPLGDTPLGESRGGGLCTAILRLIPIVCKPGKMSSFQHVYEGVLPWSLISFSTSWCCLPFSGCASCSIGRGRATPEDVSEVLVCYSLGVYETQRTPKPPE